MAIIGIQTDKQNPPYTVDDFCFWIPQYSKYMHTEDGIKYFNKLYPMLNNKIFYSIFGTDWEYAMSLGIAHYLTLIGRQLSRPVGKTLGEIANDTSINGVLTSMSVGGFSKSYDYGSVMKSGEDEAMFWNQTPYGISFYALMKSKAIPSIFVVTNGNPYENKVNDNENEGVHFHFPWSKM